MIFGTFCFVMTFHVFFTYPETCGKSLEEIDLVFEGNVPAWRSTKYGGTFQERVEQRRQSALGGGGAGADPEKHAANGGGVLGGPAGDSGEGSELGTAVPTGDSGAKEEVSHHEEV
jgi:hypothetical protein